MSRKLHLGCGRNIMPGWTNVDCVQLPGVDEVADLDACATTPLPFESDSFSEMLGSHLIEHLRNPLPFMQELHRVAQAGAKAIFRVPYGSSDDAYEDPTHARQYFLNSWSYFSQPFYWRADYGYRGDWKPEKIVLVLSKTAYEGKNAAEILADVNTKRNIVKEMVAELVAIKPIREPRRELQTTPRYELALVQP